MTRLIQNSRRLFGFVNKTRSPQRAALDRWNRKLHYYAGLSLLFFMWLFAFSGLLLNHPTWSFVESWNNRKERNYEREITTAPGPEFSTNNLEGRTPYSGLIQGSDGTLYGTTLWRCEL